MRTGVRPSGEDFGGRKGIHSRGETAEAGIAGNGVGECRYRIVFLNVQELSIAKAVEIRSVIKGGLGGMI